MKNLRLKSMLIVSHRERKARKIEFDENITVIQGTNDTGKSSVIKSIPWAFGASPHKLHQKWKAADVCVLIKFAIVNNNYSIYRHKDSYTLFDGDNNEIGTYSSVTKELGPALAKLFNFNLKLTDRDGFSVTPPPAYYLLPFYIDQDKGWTDTWSSFSNLGQFANWKKRVVGYHFGLRPDRWYELDAQKSQLRNEKDEPNRQLNSIKSISFRISEDLSKTNFDIDVDAFKKEIGLLLEESNFLRREENLYTSKMTELKTQKIKLEAQIEIVVHTHNELSNDYKYASESIDDVVGCPTCGAEYHNSFTERFEIAQDTHTCDDLLSSLRDELIKLNDGLGVLTDSIDQNMVRQKTIRKLLSRKQGEVKLKDLINLEGKKTLVTQLKEEESVLQREISSIDEKIELAEKEMVKYDSLERRSRIIKEHGERFRKYAHALGVFSLSDNAFKSVTASVEESGSDMPRSILAYFFSTVKAMSENSSATLFPLIIDSPNQQEQDKDNLKKVLEFIYKQKISSQQVIVGLVDDAAVPFDGKKLKFEQKYSVLTEDCYQEVANEIKYFQAVNLAL